MVRCYRGEVSYRVFVARPFDLAGKKVFENIVAPRLFPPSRWYRSTAPCPRANLWSNECAPL